MAVPVIYKNKSGIQFDQSYTNYITYYNKQGERSDPE